MEFQWKKQPCLYLQTLLRQVQPLEQTLEIRLTDDLPDVSRVVSAWGQCVIRSKQWRGDGMHISGGVTVSVLYLAEGDATMHSVEGWIPFHAKWNLPQTQREGHIRIHCLLKNVDARTTSARRILVRANVSVQGEALEPRQAEIVLPEQMPSDVEVLTNIYPAIVPREAGEKAFTIEDLIQMSDVQKWVCVSILPELTEQSVVGNRLLMRGNGMLHYVYIDNAGKLRSGTEEIPFAQFAELDREYETDAQTDVILCVTNLETEPMEDGLRLMCGISAQYVVSQRELLEVVEDAYSALYHMSSVMDTLVLPVELDRSMVQLETGRNPLDGELLNSVVFAEHPTQYRQENEVYYALTGQLQSVYRSNNGALQSMTEAWTVEDHIPSSENTQTKILVQGIEHRGDCVKIKLEITTCAEQRIPMVREMTLGEPKTKAPNRPTLILRRMNTDSLWELAKISGSTMESIRKANGLQEDPQEGQMLLIPIL